MCFSNHPLRYIIIYAVLIRSSVESDGSEASCNGDSLILGSAHYLKIFPETSSSSSVFIRYHHNGLQITLISNFIC